MDLRRFVLVLNEMVLLLVLEENDPRTSTKEKRIFRSYFLQTHDSSRDFRCSHRVKRVGYALHRLSQKIAAPHLTQSRLAQKPMLRLNLEHHK